MPLVVQSPLVVAIIAVISQITALLVGFAIINNTIAGEVISITIAAVNVGALVYAAVHQHAKAVVKAAQIAAVPKARAR